jgi:hypothetical protein
MASMLGPGLTAAKSGEGAASGDSPVVLAASIVPLLLLGVCC